jgi:UDP-N-acetylmuramate dehydrogenase
MMPAIETGSLRGEIRYSELLARHTTWRVGGPARCFYRPADRDDLVFFLQQLDPDEPLLWLGLGSNLLIRDGGFNGTVIATRRSLDEMQWPSRCQLYAQTGVSCAKIARATARAGLVGVEFLAGIPGTLGGALAMNAGAFGGEIWKQVIRVETIDRFGDVRQRPVTDFSIGYRHVRGPEGEWFLSAELGLKAGDVTDARKRIKQSLKQRAATQPTDLPSCGSVFRNPPGDYAGRLIEAAGLKGKRMGGAQVSDKHANFIVNTGNATAAEIEMLIELVQQEVEAHSGISLVTEVHCVGARI